MRSFIQFIAEADDYYHGTSVSKAKSILASGLKPFSRRDQAYATTSLDEALYYAIHASDAPQIAVVVIDHDYAATFFTPTMDRRGATFGHIGNAVGSTRIVPARAIREVHIYDRTAVNDYLEGNAPLPQPIHVIR